MTAYTEVSPIDAVDLLDDQYDGGDLLLDVREDDEWAVGHAPQAVHLPLDRVDANRFAGQTVLVICRSGRRSGLAAERLTEAGVRAVNVAGGMLAWAESGLEVVDDRGRAGAVK